MWGFVTENFCRVGSSAPCTTPNLEEQGISLSLAPPSKPVWHGWPYQQLCCRWHGFRVHWCTQAPSHSSKVLSTKWRYHRGGLFSITNHMYRQLSFIWGQINHCSFYHPPPLTSCPSEISRMLVDWGWFLVILWQHRGEVGVWQVGAKCQTGVSRLHSNIWRKKKESLAKKEKALTDYFNIVFLNTVHHFS
jgi:hypothetical protein